MDTVKIILAEARWAKKHDYTTYGRYRQRLESLNLTPTLLEQAIRRLSNILKV